MKTAQKMNWVRGENVDYDVNGRPRWGEPEAWYGYDEKTKPSGSDFSAIINEVVHDFRRGSGGEPPWVPLKFWRLYAAWDDGISIRKHHTMDFDTLEEAQSFLEKN